MEEQYLVINKESVIVAHFKTEKEAQIYVKERPYLKYERFCPDNEIFVEELDDDLPF